MVRLALSFASVKITAVYLGPEGIALTGQIANLINLLSGMMATPLNTAVTRFTAEYNGDEVKVSRLLGSAVKLTLLLCLIVTGCLILAAEPLARRFLQNAGYAWIILLLAGSIIPIVFSPLISGLLTGQKRMGLVSTAMTVNNLLGFAVFVSLSVSAGIPGGLEGLVISYGLGFFFMLLCALRVRAFTWRQLWGTASGSEARKILGFFPLLIAHAVCGPLALILIRDQIAQRVGLGEAGNWQAVWRLSEVYLTVFASSLSLYFMPRLAEITHPFELRREILRTVGAVCGLLSLAALALFFCRDLVIHLLFTAKFISMRDLFPAQLVGDVFKMASWSCGFVLVAKDYKKWYMTLEVLIPALFVGLSIYFLQVWGTKGVTYAYVTTYACNLILLIIALRKIIFARGR